MPTAETDQTLSPTTKGYQAQKVDTEIVTSLGENVKYTEVPTPGGLIYRTKAHFDTTFLVIIVGLLGFLLCLGIGLSFLTWIAGVVLISEAFFFGFIIAIIVPSKIEIYNDRLVVHTIIFKFTTLLSNIIGVSTVADCEYVRAFKLATAMSGRVLVQRRNHWLDILFCPRYPDEFISFLRYAMSPGTRDRPTLRHESWVASPTVV